MHISRKSNAHFSEKSNDMQQIGQLLLPSLLGIVLCVCCLLGGTFAWFSATNTVTMPPISTATYQVTAVVGKDGLILAATEGTYALPMGTYDVTLTASGTASSGYCMLHLNGEKIRTGSIVPGETKTLMLTVEGDMATLKLIAEWGSPNPDIPLIGDVFTYRATAFAA